MKRASSYALGCKVNQYESEAIAELFSKKGYSIVGVDEEADVYVINTCTVTNFGDKKSRQLIRKVKRQNPDAIVAVIGCYAQTAPEDLMAVEGINLILGTKDRACIVEMVEDYQVGTGVKNYVSDIMKERIFEPLFIEKLANRTRAYLKIQDGCNMYCTYCIIPYARGPIRSREPEDVLEEVKRLVANGFKEVVLTGIHVASYGKERGDTSLLDILERVHEVDGIERIRISSVEPNVVTEAFAKRMSELPKICDHFHLSLQSGCAHTLKEMNRHYDTAKYRQAAGLLRKYMPNAALTTDIIVGFPGEREEDFAESYAFAKEMAFAKIHVFPYSPKQGTPAAERTDQIPNAIKSERSRKLLALSDGMAETFLRAQIGSVSEVLFEKEVEPGVYEGYTTNYMRVHCAAKTDLSNAVERVVLAKMQDEILWAQREL